MDLLTDKVLTYWCITALNVLLLWNEKIETTGQPERIRNIIKYYSAGVDDRKINAKLIQWWKLKIEEWRSCEPVEDLRSKNEGKKWGNKQSPPARSFRSRSEMKGVAVGVGLSAYVKLWLVAFWILRET